MAEEPSDDSGTPTGTDSHNRNQGSDVIWNKKTKPRGLFTAKFITAIENGRTFVIGHDFGLDFYRRMGDCEFRRVARRNEENFPIALRAGDVDREDHVGVWLDCKDTNSYSIAVCNYMTGEGVMTTRNHMESDIGYWKFVDFTPDYAVITGNNSFNVASLCYRVGILPLADLNSELQLLQEEPENDGIREYIAKGTFRTSARSQIAGLFSLYSDSEKHKSYYDYKWFLGIMDIPSRTMRKLIIPACSNCYQSLMPSAEDQKKCFKDECIRSVRFDRSGDFLVVGTRVSARVYDSATGALYKLETFFANALEKKLHPTAKNLLITSDRRFLCVRPVPGIYPEDKTPPRYTLLVFKLPIESEMERTTMTELTATSSGIKELHRKFCIVLTGLPLYAHGLVRATFAPEKILAATTVVVDGANWLQLFHKDGKISCAPIEERGYIKIT